MTDSMECCKALIGATLKEQELASVDCYVRPQLGIFIPAVGACGYAARREHTHPAYMVCIMVAGGEDKYHTAEITLDAQAEIITHWIIRSLTGESLDMRRAMLFWTGCPDQSDRMRRRSI